MSNFNEEIMKRDFIEELNIKLSKTFEDFKGLYFFGSRIKGKQKKNSDYDIVLLFESLSYEKELQIAGIISYTEYLNNVFIDYKTLTVKGEKSLDYIRKNVNPVFIHEAIDNGIFYGRT